MQRYGAHTDGGSRTLSRSGCLVGGNVTADACHHHSVKRYSADQMNGLAKVLVPNDLNFIRFRPAMFAKYNKKTHLNSLSTV